MGQQRPPREQSASEVSVVEGAVPDETWQGISLDLAALRSEAGEARRRWDASVSTTRTWATPRALPPVPSEPASDRLSPVEAPAMTEVPLAPPRRVPVEDIVVIGRKAAPPKKKGLWRDLFFFAVLAATLYGAFYSGRMNAYQRVIVVPIPESRLSVIT